MPLFKERGLIFLYKTHTLKRAIEASMKRNFTDNFLLIKKHFLDETLIRSIFEILKTYIDNYI